MVKLEEFGPVCKTTEYAAATPSFTSMSVIARLWLAGVKYCNESEVGGMQALGDPGEAQDNIGSRFALPAWRHPPRWPGCECVCKLNERGRHGVGAAWNGYGEYGE